jgi:hypothetical protein
MSAFDGSLITFAEKVPYQGGFETFSECHRSGPSIGGSATTSTHELPNALVNELA